VKEEIFLFLKEGVLDKIDRTGKGIYIKKININYSLGIGDKIIGAYITFRDLETKEWFIHRYEELDDKNNNVSEM